MTGYNITRSAEELLDKYESSPPSFSIHLYSEYWTLNNGPKFLYNNPIASLLDDVRAHRIPVDYLELFDSAHVPFYDGCMLVELLDYRPKRSKDPPLEKPERSRVTLHPSDETLWADLCLLNQRTGSKFTDPEVLELEAQILLHTAPPICLDPDPHLTRIANHTLRVSTPSIPVSLKRKAAAISPEEDESDRVRRGKIMQFMNPRLNRSHVPSYRILDTLRRVREARQAEAQAQLAQAIANPPSRSAQPPPPAPPIHGAAPTPPTTVDASKARQVKKKPEGLSPISPAGSRTTMTPAPHPTVNQLQSRSSTNSPPVNNRSPLPANAYQQLQVGTPMAAPSPAQRGYTQSPRPPSSQALHSSPLASGSQLPQQDNRPPSGQVHFMQAAPGSTPSKPATPQVGYSTQPTPPLQQANAQISQVAAAQAQTQAQAQAQAPVQAAHPNLQNMYAQMQHLQRMSHAAQAQAQTQVQNGRATPQGGALPRSPMVVAQGGPARSSPMVSHQSLATRSPMPNASPLQQMTQTSQHPTMSAVPQAQYNFAQFQPITHAQANAHAQHAQVAHLAQAQQQNMGAPGQVSDAQQAMMMQYPMYGYPVGYGMAPGGRLQAPYTWTGLGRAMPNQINGQTPGVQPGLPQQMPVQGKAAQAGVPGR
ncbi:Spt20 family-domain-containing protein [Phlebopus sp. FC_14]|nr:Spt20 family-domain-containing protein [Phlebopus sp. FC_14]